MLGVHGVHTLQFQYMVLQQPSRLERIADLKRVRLTREAIENRDGIRIAGVAEGVGHRVRGGEHRAAHAARAGDLEGEKHAR